MTENLFTENYRYFHYYHHTQYPLSIRVDVTDSLISCHVMKMYKMDITKELKKESKLVGKMSNEQVEQYVLDCVEIFLKK